MVIKKCKPEDKQCHGQKKEKAKTETMVNKIHHRS